MANYSNLSKKSIEDILKRYGLIYESHQSISAGQENSNFIVDTQQGRYILTLFEVPQRRVFRLVRLLNHLRKFGFPTSRVKSLPNGAPTSDHLGKPVMLKRFIGGKNPLTPKTVPAFQLGEALANLHQIPAPTYLPTDHVYERHILMRIRKEKGNSAFCKWLNAAVARLQKQIPDHLPRALVHGDIFCDNLLIEKEQLTAVIDFEDACRHYRIFDLGMAVIGTCAEKGEINLEATAALVTGYQSILSLSENEKHSLQRSTEYAATLTAGWRFWKYRISVPDPKRANDYSKMVTLAEHARGISTALFRKTIFS